MKAFTLFLFLTSMGFIYQSKAMSVTANVSTKFCKHPAISGTSGFFLPSQQMDDPITINKFNKNNIAIHYQLQVAASATICLYDLAGNKIANVLNAVLPAGDYVEEYPFNKDLIPGVYFVTIESDNFRITRKIGIQ
jgi:hypothetical protein